MRTALFACGCVLWAAVSFAQYVPPAGVPSPAFGVNETAPAPTLYVNASTGNDGNAGTIGSPKATIPRNLSAGTVVQVSGAQTASYTSPNGLHISGSVGSPVWIVSDPASAMSFSGSGEIDGTYLIMEGGSTHGWTIRDTAANGDSNHLAIRNVTFTSGGLGIGAFGSGTISQIVVKGVNIHNVGVIAEGENGGDSHCVTINRWTDHVWVVDNLLYLCSGDGVQVNAAGGSGTCDATCRGGTHHIYIGRNVMASNRQSGAWAKYSEDVVMTQNVCTGMRAIVEPVGAPDAGMYLNPGLCFGGQYDAVRPIVMQNLITNSDNGIVFAGFNADAAGAGITIVGNTLWNIHDITYPGSLADCGSAGTAIILRDGFGGARFVANNTISDVRVGIGSTPGALAKTYANNIFATNSAADVCWETDAPTITYNNFDNAAVFSPSTSSSNSVIGDPLFVNAATAEFTLRVGSPALHAGLGYDVNTDYIALHGVSTGLSYATLPNIGASQADPAAPGSRPVVRLRFR